MEDKNKKSSATEIMLAFTIAILFIIAFVYGLNGGDFQFVEDVFKGKSERCKQEAEDKAASLRDKELEGLKLKATLTPQDLEEIERLEINQKTNLVDREDYEYLYKNCMK